MFEIKKINDYISYIPCSQKPLSSDVVIIKGSTKTYIYDVGSTLGNLNALHSFPDDKVIIVSHFHADHTWWLTKHYEGEDGLAPDDTVSLNYEPVKCSRIYSGSYTVKHIATAEAVNERLTINDGVKLDIIPLPSSHCKGSLALMVNDEYLFLGDGTYPSYKDNNGIYNVQLLNDEIKLLESLPAENCGLSHDRRFIRPKKVVLRQLQTVYQQRTPDSPLIVLTGPV